MAWRILRGKNSAGTFGFWVSKPGYDVLSADRMQMAFSSDLKSPRLVAQSTVVIAPLNGERSKDANTPGGRMTSTDIYFGRTIFPLPVAIIIASAPQWRLPIAPLQTIHLDYLAGQWHTPIYENFGGGTSAAPMGDYGSPIWRVFAGMVGDSNGVSETWACCRVYPYVMPDRLRIQANNSSTLTVKCLVLEYP